MNSYPQTVPQPRFSVSLRATIALFALSHLLLSPAPRSRWGLSRAT